MLRTLSLVVAISYVVTAPGVPPVKDEEVINYMDGLFYEDLAHHFMVLMVSDCCYFWHMTNADVSIGLSPSGIRSIQGNFIRQLNKGVAMFRIHRPNFNHMSASIVFRCRDKRSFLLRRVPFDHADLSSIDLQGAILANSTVIHASGHRHT